MALRLNLGRFTQYVPPDPAKQQQNAIRAAVDELYEQMLAPTFRAAQKLAPNANIYDDDPTVYDDRMTGDQEQAIRRDRERAEGPGFRWAGLR